jgi:hypothetical protein
MKDIAPLILLGTWLAGGNILWAPVKWETWWSSALPGCLTAAFLIMQYEAMQYEVGMMKFES